MPTEPGPTVSEDAVRATVHRELVDAGVSATAVRPDAPLDDLGLDSLDVEQLLLALRTGFGADLQREDIAGLTVDGLVALVTSGRGGEPAP